MKKKVYDRRRRARAACGPPRWPAAGATSVDPLRPNENLGGQVLTAMKGSGRDEFGVIIRNEKEQVDRRPAQR